MKINLLYNKIVADTVTESFIESFEAAVNKAFFDKHADIDELVIYEDYLSDRFVVNGMFCCPLTLARGDEFSYAYASWRTDSKKFKDSVPYAYVGKEPLNIDISFDAPREIKEKLEGRVPFFAKNAIKAAPYADVPSKTFLSGRYSQSFIDVLREKITEAIEAEFNIAKASESSLELSLTFAPESFMEHVLDNVSYRRLLLSAKSCAPRDLWIKWTRLDGNGTYTAQSHVREEDILFELCDDVPQKIREREYRYLIKTDGISVYKNAMSRKNFTEWRELVKRVIKRGEVLTLQEAETQEKLMPKDFIELPTEPLRDFENESTPEKDDAFDSELSLKLQSVLGNYSAESEEAETPEEDINPDITELLRTLLAGGAEENATTGEDFSKEEDENNEVEEENELPPFDIDTPKEEDTDALVDILDTIAKEAESEKIEESEEKEEIKEEIKEDSDTISELLTTYAAKEDDTYAISQEKEDEIAKLKECNEELETKLSLLEAENNKLLMMLANYEKAAEEAKRERATLIESLDAAKRREEREKDRLAEAARIAVAERYEAEKPKEVEEDSDKAERELAKLREEEERRELEKAARLREEAEREEARQRLERETRELEKSTPVRYVSKVADISFRHPVDPNITKRIQEIIITTVKYFGKENVYMKIKATIPDNYMVRLEFVKIPENESALLSDIIRVLGHSKLGITKVLLD